MPDHADGTVGNTVGLPVFVSTHLAGLSVGSLVRKAIGLYDVGQLVDLVVVIEQLV